MSKTTQTARERIGHALFMLAAGADEAVLMQTLRAFLLQHIQTTEQATELLRELAAVNPSAFTESLQILAAEKKHRVDGIVTQIEQQNAAMQKQVARHKRATANTAKAQPKKLKRLVRPNIGRHVSS